MVAACRLSLSLTAAFGEFEVIKETLTVLLVIMGGLPMELLLFAVMTDVTDVTIGLAGEKLILELLSANLEAKLISDCGIVFWDVLKSSVEQTTELKFLRALNCKGDMVPKVVEQETAESNDNVLLDDVAETIVDAVEVCCAS